MITGETAGKRSFPPPPISSKQRQKVQVPGRCWLLLKTGGGGGSQRRVSFEEKLEPSRRLQTQG